jgi:hypothetical protein
MTISGWRLICPVVVEAWSKASRATSYPLGSNTSRRESGCRRQIEDLTGHELPATNSVCPETKDAGSQSPGTRVGKRARVRLPLP